MELRNGKRLLCPAPPTRIDRRRPRTFRLLDLPAELRFMIYGYVFGYENVHWTMTYESVPASGYVLALGHIIDSIVIPRNISLHQRHLGLLQTCRQVSKEASAIFYNQTRFDIGFCPNNDFKLDSAYRLHLTHAGAKISDGLAADVLQRVQHVRFSFRDERRRYTHTWLMFLLCRFLCYGERLKSLRFVEDGNDENSWYTYHSILSFKLYRGDAILELRNTTHTDEEVAKLKETSRCTYSSILLSTLSRQYADIITGAKNTFTIIVVRESDLSSDKN